MPDCIIAERQAEQARRQLRRLARARRDMERRADRAKTLALAAGWAMALIATARFLALFY